MLCLNIFVEKPKLFRRTGQLLEVYPISKKRRVFIQLYCSHHFIFKNASQIMILKKVKAIIMKARISLRPPFVHSI